MNAHEDGLPAFDLEPVNGVLLSAVTILDRKMLVALSHDEAAALWGTVHHGTKARLTTAIARFYVDHHDATIHDMPAHSALAWDSDPDAIGYVLSAMAYKHEDLSHMLADDDALTDSDAWIRLRTKCGCESRTVKYPKPLPPAIYKHTRDGARTFRWAGVNAFGAVLYHEA